MRRSVTAWVELGSLEKLQATSDLIVAAAHATHSRQLPCVFSTLPQVKHAKDYVVEQLPPKHSHSVNSTPSQASHL